MLTLNYIDALFLAALLVTVGFSVGVLVSALFVSRGWNYGLVAQKTFGFFFAVTYVMLQIYVVLTQGQPLDWFFGAAGFVVIGYVLGINLGEYLPSRKS